MPRWLSSKSADISAPSSPGPKGLCGGADIKEMLPKTYMGRLSRDFISSWEQVSQVHKPLIAAVAGLPWAGAAELAMMCDFIIAADTAKFGQPEIKLGSCRRSAEPKGSPLRRQIKAMDMCLTGRMMDAAEAERSSLVSRWCRPPPCSTRR